jgi:hypothetical protein
LKKEPQRTDFEEVTEMENDELDVVRDWEMPLCTIYQQDNHDPPPSKYTEKLPPWQAKYSLNSLKYHKKQDFPSFVFQI